VFFLLVLVYAAWLQVSNGSADIRAVVKTNGEFIHAGGVEARSGCWSILKGGLTAPASGAAELYFEVNKPDAFALHDRCKKRSR
jgi:hypothetical protein